MKLTTVVSVFLLVVPAVMQSQTGSAQDVKHSLVAASFANCDSGIAIDAIVKQPALNSNVSPRKQPNPDVSPDENRLPADVTVLHGVLGGTPAPQDAQPSEYPSSLLLQQVQNSDAAIVATVEGNNPSEFTPRRGFLFTVFSVRVEEVIFGQSQHLQPNQIVHVARCGGSTTVEGKHVTAIDPNFKWLKAGHQYIFLLHKIPGTTTFRIYPGGTFTIEANGSVKSAFEVDTYPRLASMYNRFAFEDEIRSAFNSIRGDRK